ncbi:rod shape-determining protein RodA [Candidatus Hakubella thermalkaliphila]|uniref:Peptidoglycan glycosyltransferase RodA n=1 Tax=Candidatus Hakubella thermalkaliphila TaxID=2754717 RepID=A0A6V8PEP7_9ACTN|nr:rod shape-determining protein RodA [Candidatus Hakubella thermalkaliphila]GFP29316.1 rod shape determining protein RodA [Candidatus Hakubella thermalkaliphila]
MYETNHELRSGLGSPPKFSFDFVLPLASLLLGLYGALLIYSATGVGEFWLTQDPYFYLKRQILFLIVGLTLFFVVTIFNYAVLRGVWIWIYFLNLAGLSLVHFFGQEVHGSRSWLGWGGYGIQPSEFGKIVLIITLAAFLSNRKGESRSLKDVILSLIHVGMPIVLILREPDIGMSLVYLAILLGMMFVAGIRSSYLIGLGIMGSAGVVAMVSLGLVKEHIVKRLIVFLNPAFDPLGAGYALDQSKIAIGSGELWGKGLFLGSQTHLNFVPEQHTDFIFSVLGEELGFMGALLLFLLYGLLIWRCLAVARKSRDLFGIYICVGVVSMLVFQIFINVGMAIGIMPIAGLPLPFLSYGGSSLISTLLGLGLVENVYIHRQTL